MSKFARLAAFNNHLFSRYPFQYSTILGTTLWVAGDVGAQCTESAHCCGGRVEQGAVDWHRAAVTGITGGILNGGLGYFWYKRLDVVVRKVFQPSSIPFVAAKIGLELGFWQPVTLALLWLSMGLFLQRDGVDAIQQRVSRDLPSVMLYEWGLWLPIDVLNFSIVPVQKQVILINFGSMFEALLVSYLHARSAAHHHHDETALVHLEDERGTSSVAAGVTVDASLPRFLGSPTLL